MIFESLLLDKVQDDVEKRLKESNLDPNSNQYENEEYKIISEETFAYFKVSYFWFLFYFIEKLLQCMEIQESNLGL